MIQLILLSLSLLSLSPTSAALPPTPSVYTIAQNVSSGVYSVEEVSFSRDKGDGDTVRAEVKTIVDDPSLTSYLHEGSASNCNALSADGKHWHMIAYSEKDELALLSIDVGSKNKASLHTLSPRIGTKNNLPLGCVWYEKESELIMHWFNVTDGEVNHNFDAIDVSTGKLRHITTWTTPLPRTSFTLTSIDAHGHLLVADTNVDARGLLFLDAAATNETWPDPLVANATLSQTAFAVGTAADDTVFLALPPGSNGTMATFGSAPTHDLLGADPTTAVNVTSPSDWTMKNPGRAQVVDDTTIFYAGGSGVWSADSTAFFTFCSFKLPLRDAPSCVNSTSIKRMTWAAVVAPPRGSGPTGTGTIVAIVLGSLAGVALCVAAVVLYRRRYGGSSGYTAV